LNIIRFSHRYSKLRHPIWTTIRRITAEKEMYYCRLVGHVLAVQIEGDAFPVGQAVLCHVGRATVGDLPADFLDYDTDRGKYYLDPKMDGLILLFCWEGGQIPESL